MHGTPAPVPDDAHAAVAADQSERARALSLWLNVSADAVAGRDPDLTQRQTALLLVVHLEPGPHTIRGLAARLRLAKPAVVRAVDTLSAAGLVERRPDPADRRSVHVRATLEAARRLDAFARLIARELAPPASAAAPDAVSEGRQAA